MINPLLLGTELPAYADIRPEHVTPALDEVLAAADAALERAVGPEVAADYDAMATVLDTAVERLRYVWDQVSFLQSVADTPELRASHAHNLPRVIEFYTRLGADERLYAKYRAMAASPEAAALSPARRKALADALRDFVLGGADLRGAARERFATIQDRSGALSQQFGDHVLDATDSFELFVEPEALAGVPADVVQAARDGAAAAGRAGCRLTLQQPCYGPVMQFATGRRSVRATASPNSAS